MLPLCTPGLATAVPMATNSASGCPPECIWTSSLRPMTPCPPTCWARRSIAVSASWRAWYIAWVSSVISWLVFQFEYLDAEVVDGAADHQAARLVADLLEQHGLVDGEVAAEAAAALAVAAVPGQAGQRRVGARVGDDRHQRSLMMGRGGSSSGSLA